MFKSFFIRLFIVAFLSSIFFVLSLPFSKFAISADEWVYKKYWAYYTTNDSTYYLNGQYCNGSSSLSGNPSCPAVAGSAKWRCVSPITRSGLGLNAQALSRGYQCETNNNPCDPPLVWQQSSQSCGCGVGYELIDGVCAPVACPPNSPAGFEIKSIDPVVCGCPTGQTVLVSSMSCVDTAIANESCTTDYVNGTYASQSYPDGTHIGTCGCTTATQVQLYDPVTNTSKQYCQAAPNDCPAGSTLGQTGAGETLTTRCIKDPVDPPPADCNADPYDERCAACQSNSTAEGCNDMYNCSAHPESPYCTFCAANPDDPFCHAPDNGTGGGDNGGGTGTGGTGTGGTGTGGTGTGGTGTGTETCMDPTGNSCVQSGTEEPCTDPATQNCVPALDQSTGFASGGDDCLHAPTCTGDSVGCAQLKQQWLTRCESLPLPTRETFAGFDYLDLAAQTNVVKNEYKAQIALMQSQVPTLFNSLPTSTGHSIAGFTFTFHNQVFTIDMNKFNDFFGILGAVIFASSALIALSIVLRGK